MRARLILVVGATSSLILVAFLVPLAVLVHSAASDRAVNAAVVEAQALSPVVAVADAPTLAAAVEHANATGTHQLTVFLPDGQVVGAAAPRTAAVDTAAGGRSVTVPTGGGMELALTVAGLPDGNAVIRTVVPNSELHAGVARAWTALGLLGVGLLLVSLLVAAQLARAMTRPLSAVAEVSYQLASGEMEARAGDRGPPEVRQVSAGLNLLAGRISELLAQERATVADLSHRLRTPLTRLRIDAEASTDPALRARLIADLDAVDNNLDAVIREADRPVREGVAVACDASEAVTERVRFWSTLAEEENRPFTSHIAPGPTPVRLSRGDLTACVDALLGNIFKHTPEGAAFLVELREHPAGGATLLVADAGPGLPDAEVLRRGMSGAGSTGLGLSIVARAAARSGGGVRLDRSHWGGAAVLVDLGPPPPPVIRGHRAPRRRLR
jgi:signal transduction histidine kinase